MVGIYRQPSGDGFRCGSGRSHQKTAWDQVNQPALGEPVPTGSGTVQSRCRSHSAARRRGTMRKVHAFVQERPPRRVARSVDRDHASSTGLGVIRHAMARAHRDTQISGELLRERHRSHRLGPVDGEHEVVPDRIRQGFYDSRDVRHVRNFFARCSNHDAEPVIRWHAEAAVEQRGRAGVRGPQPQTGRDRHHTCPVGGLRREILGQLGFPRRCGKSGPVAFGHSPAPEAHPPGARPRREELTAAQDDQFTLGCDHFDTQLPGQSRR